MFFFLPRLVVSRTSGDEFHSLKATAMRWERSHWLNKDSCVDLPEPSIPSTTMSLPRWRFGTRRGIGEGAFHYNRAARAGVFAEAPIESSWATTSPESC